MKFVQNSYQINTNAAYAGLLTDISFVTRVDTFRNVDTVTIDFGLAVIRGAQDNTALLPSAPGQTFLGITVRSLARENIPPIGSGVTGYVVGDEIGVLRTNGRIWVRVLDAVSADGAVYFSNVAPTFGQFQATAVDGDLVPNATYDSSAGAGELAVIILGNP